MPKASKKRNATTKSAADRRTRARDVTHEEIARRAYEIYERRGSVSGHAVDDWLQAERELREGVALQGA